VNASSNRRPLYFIAILLCLIFVISYVGRLSRRASLGAEIVAKEQLIEEAVERQFELEEYRTYVGSDAYVEEVMREEFGMAREGETLMVLVDPPSLPTPTPDAGEGVAPPLGPAVDLAEGAMEGAAASADPDGGVESGQAADEPTWRQWVSLFAGSGR
jgi:hypothetical protein